MMIKRIRSNRIKAKIQHKLIKKDKFVKRRRKIKRKNDQIKHYDCLYLLKIYTKILNI